MAPSPIAKQFLTNSVAHPEVKKSPEFHTRSPASESFSGVMTEAMRAQEKLIAKTHPKAAKLRLNCDGQTTTFDPTKLAETRELSLSVSKKQEQQQEQQPHDGTNGHHLDDSDGADADERLGTAWWGLLDATREVAATKTSLAESMRLSQAAVAEVARASSSVADHEELLVRAQGEIVMRQQEIRRLQEHIKRLAAELRERDDAIHEARKATHDARKSARDAEAFSRKEKAAEPHGDTPHVKPATDEDGKVLDDVVKLIGELELRYTRINESLERTHLMFREALALVVPGYAGRLAEKKALETKSAAQAAIDAGEDSFVL